MKREDSKGKNKRNAPQKEKKKILKIDELNEIIELNNEIFKNENNKGEINITKK